MAAFFAQAGLAVKGNTTVYNREVTYKNVAYGELAAQKMDVYLPANRGASTPAIVLIHGGAWMNGDKSSFNDVVAEIRKRLPGYAVFNLNHRLATYQGENVWPSQIEDINKAIGFIKEKSGEYLFNPAAIVMMGASSGAHLALLQAYKYNEDNSVKAVVDLFGPTDLGYIFTNAPYPPVRLMLNLFLGGTPENNADAYRGASPIFHISKQSPPTIIFHGGADNTVPITQSED
ncbi:MAG: alpha/beta hydrolase, partial [Gemmatimonadaceae bacterium]|nr:alpha/beta hydrolase [Chitinophagaceae bacterium]